MKSLNFKQIVFPEDFEYSSDKSNLPLEFYLEALPRSKTIFLKLGYFSSSAIRVLAFGFAQFIFGGGTINIVSNHFLYRQDKDLINSDIKFNSEIDLSDLKALKSNLTDSEQHFFNCLKYLTTQNRLKIVPVMLLPDRMAHYKQGVFIDHDGNELFMDGSCNFTSSGLTQNGETISIFRSWGSDFEKSKINGKRTNIESIVKKADANYKYLVESEILDAVNSLGKELPLVELLKNERQLVLNSLDIRLRSIIRRHERLLEEKIEYVNNSPRFPFDSGPREYQKEAYQKWLAAEKKGVFAMATGTGKTITALNCMLEEYRLNGCYQFIVLAPSKVLIKQWKEEIQSFNFKNVITASSDNGRWRDEISNLNNSLYFDDKTNFCLVVTYASFVKDKFQKLIKDLPNSTTFIADEAHNIGSKSFKPLLPTLKFKNRLALSATLERYFDDEGDQLIQSFFNSKPPYTYSFSMKRAISEGVLCEYTYYPHVVSLSDDELEAYIEISKTLIKFFDFESLSFKKSDIVERLLLARKRIIHKAVNKLIKFSSILAEEKKQNGALKYSFVYVPEGLNEDGDNILDDYLSTFERLNPESKAYAYTSDSQNKDEIMKLFEEGVADVLFSMKCLDEGVDVPRAQLAIFCSSTGNPKQFIQRRGRVLRTHPEKSRAVIHDLIVAPKYSGNESTKNIETKLIKDELTRVIYFASLANNYYEAMQKCNSIAKNYGLDLYSLHEELSGKL